MTSCIFRKRIVIGGLVGVVGLLLLWMPNTDPASEAFLTETGEDQFWRELNECTTGLASGMATPDGRPLLWKNRDVAPNQEFHYVDDGRIPFISITYSGETDEYYGGINAAGFAVENSDSYNLPGGPYRNGWGSGSDDGEIHMLALATCRTVDDFEALMDSTNEDGRTLNCNYGTIDAFGGAAMFETGGYSYTRIDAAETEDGFIVRSNYSYSGDRQDNRPSHFGPHRHDAGYELWKAAVDEGSLTPRYIFQQVIRNLSIEGLDPYPLPFDGYWNNYPYGCIPNSGAICRSSTAGVLVVQGVRDGERPDDAILWAMCGRPLAAVVTPLWVRAGSTPPELDGLNGSRICDRAIELNNWVTQPGAVDTWRLTNPDGNGLWDYTFPLEDWVFAKTEQFLNSPRFNYDRLEAFQGEIAQQVADSLEAWSPTYPITEVVGLIFIDNNILLIWGEPDEDGNGGRNLPGGYAVYRSDHPFRDGDRGTRLAIVEETEYIDTDPLPGAAFYRIEALF